MSFSSFGDIPKVDYTYADGMAKYACFGAVDVDLSGLKVNEIKLVKHLLNVADLMNPIFVDIFNEHTVVILDVLSQLISSSHVTAVEGQLLKNYKSIIQLQNGIFSLDPRTNLRLNVEESRLKQLLDLINISENVQNLILPYFLTTVPISDRCKYYPPEITEEQLKALGEMGKQVNTLVYKNKEGVYVTVPIEYYYRGSFEKINESLSAARDIALDENPSFALYLDAKINEFRTGTVEAQRIADALWVKHNYKIDFIASAALEVYLDYWMNFKGAPSTAVLLRNSSLDGYANLILTNAGALEREGPSKFFRQDTSKVELILRPVDVITWSGDYTTSPFTTIAQSLPNNEWVSKHVGNVNLLYINTGIAVQNISRQKNLREFLPAAVFAALEPQLTAGDNLQSMAHEVGHTTGRLTDELTAKKADPHKILEKEYSTLEELRAELFGMYVVDNLKAKNLITKDVAEASHYYMLVTCVCALKLPATQAHQSARTMMYHFFEERGCIAVEDVQTEEEGPDKQKRTVTTKKFRYTDFAKLKEAVLAFLSIVQEIKSHCDKEAAQKLREKYCYDDKLMDYVSSRTQDVPTGRGLLFPRIVEKAAAAAAGSWTDAEGHARTVGVLREVELPGGDYVLQYPTNFADMQRFHTKLVPPFGYEE